MNKLLDRLKQVDPTTYNRYNTDKIICDMYLVIAVKDAWLQACLQEAISGKGWTYKLYYNPDPVKFHPKYGAYILPNLKSSGPCHNAESDSMVKSLLAAYIAACEAMT